MFTSEKTAALEIQLLADFQIRYQGRSLTGLESPRLRSLLAYLLLHRDAPQSRKHLAFLLWQDSSEQQAHGNLRNLVLKLRRGLPAADTFLMADMQTLQWRADAPFTLDVDEFEKGVKTNSLAALERAVNLYRGDLVPACYDEWLLPERERLREMYVDALAQLVVLAEAAQDYQTGVVYARRLLQADPLSEEAYRKLMYLYARLGDRTNVVRVYQTCVAVLKRELDAEPGDTTRTTFEQLRKGEMPIERPTAPRVQAKPNLPVPPTSFVGRTRELKDTRTLLDHAHLVTLIGVGGGGKTRLAIQAAHEVESGFADGAWFVDFSPLSTSLQVPEACASVFGLQEKEGKSATEMVAEYTGEKELLLVLDNCEHLLSACAGLAQIILKRAPRVCVLATSREPLNVPGEAILIVPPLSLPTVEQATLESLSQSDAVQLFSARAAFNLPTFVLNQGNYQAVAQICRQLDGIPLAIELAAARIRALTPVQIAARLDDALAVLTRGSASVSARHQTMRGVLDWSDALLSDGERALFRRLAVFAGGFSLEAAEAVCADDLSLSPPLILDLLSNLIDKSLVSTLEVEQGEEARYRLLEPIRQYAREKLHAADENEIFAARHLTWCVSLAESVERELEGAKQPMAFLRLEREHDNLRTALEFAVHSEDRESGLRLAAALERFWLNGGHPIEGRGWLNRLLTPQGSLGDRIRAVPPGDPAIYARAMGVAGLLAWRQNDYAQAEACDNEALRVWRELQNQSGIALILRQLGDVARLRGEYARAFGLLEESLELSRVLGNARGIAATLNSFGAALSEHGDYERARAFHQEGLALAQQFGDVWLTAMLMNNLGVALRLAEPDRAETLVRDTLPLRSLVRDWYGMAISLRNLGELALARQDWEQARAMFAESLTLNQSMRIEKGVADCLVGLAWVEHAREHDERAARLLAANERLRESIHAPLPEDDRAEHAELVNRVRARLDRYVFETAWAEGRMLTLDQAATFALDKPPG